MNVKLKFLLACCLLLLGGKCWALRVTLSEAQINTMLKASFPIKQSYKGVNVEFTEARVKLDALDETVKIATTIIANDATGTLRAKGVVKGKLEYDNFDKQLHIEKPQLDDFTVLENSMANAKEPIRIIRQTIGRDLPLIVVIDFNQLNIEYLGLIPKEIDVMQSGLQIVF